MAAYTKKAIFVSCFLLLICHIVNAEEEIKEELSSKEELVESESKDGKLEIIKQIKKVNDDGSYTIGYEADDGSFKIESRDVLGNIKGTYGYIDESGQIKRVSYSTSNTTEIIPQPEITTSSVVQRIPKLNRTSILSTTKRPYPSYSTTQSTPTSTNNIIQRLQKLRGSLSSTTTTTTTTEKPKNFNSVETTIKPVYASSTPRILLQSRPIVRATPASQLPTQKSEGQIIRPEVITTKPTELPLFKRLALKHPYLSDTKSTEEPEQVRSNILRRQLSQEKSEFDPQQHLFTLQQSLGNDATDVYSASVTTGTPRPLFTTTNRPRALLSSTSAPIVITPRPTVKYAQNYHRNNLQDVETTVREYTQEATTTEAASTPTPAPVVQIPANRATPEPLVAIRHPYQRGTILVPLSQIQNSLGPIEMIENPSQLIRNEDQYVRETTPKPENPVEPRTLYVRRLPPPHLRPIPVHVDENGYIREVVPQPNIAPTPYPLPVPMTPPPHYINEDVDNDIDKISPPVSTKDFQKLLQQLIVRQTRLERISELTNPRRHPELYQQPRYRPLFRPVPVYVQRNPELQSNGPVQFVNEDQQRQRYVQIPQHVLRQNNQQRQEELYQRQYQNEDQQSYTPTRRVARLLQPAHEQRHQGNDVNEEYLPPDVREMLLLRMLQLAINPALPLGEDEVAEGTTPIPQYKKAPVRNVEILGEENSNEDKRSTRIKRYRERDLDYYDDKYY